LRAAGLLDNRPLPGQSATDDEDEAATGQSELFED
jgi:segregation and condensation protein B